MSESLIAAPVPSRSDPIAENLRGTHAFIRATRAAAKGLRPGPDGRLTVGERPGVVRMVVSRDRLHRALLLAHSVTAGARHRGWNIEPYSKVGHGHNLGVAITIREHQYPIEVHEETRTLPFTQEEIDAWRNEYSWMNDRADKMPPPQRKRKEPTGTLRLVLPNGYRGGRASWTDSPRSLNGSLSDVLDSLEDRATEDDVAAENARRHRKSSSKRRDFELNVPVSLVSRTRAPTVPPQRSPPGARRTNLQTTQPSFANDFQTSTKRNGTVLRRGANG